jgi:hypothetical protein
MSDWLDEEEPEDEGIDDETADWLSLQPPTSGDDLTPKSPGDGDAFSAILYDDCTPRVPGNIELPVPAGTNSKYVKVIHAARRLMPKQRVFIRAMIQSARNVRTALNLYNARNAAPLSFGQVMSWMRTPEYLEVLKAAQEHFLDLAGIDPKDQLFKAVKVFDEAMTPAPILHKGKHTGYFEQDRANALRALEHVGRLTGATKEADTTRVTVQIVNLSSRAEDKPGVVTEQNG